MWSLIGLAVSAIGVFVEYMGEKEEKNEQEKEMNDLRDRIQRLESQRRDDNEVR